MKGPKKRKSRNSRAARGGRKAHEMKVGIHSKEFKEFTQSKVWGEGIRGRRGGLYRKAKVRYGHRGYREAGRKGKGKGDMGRPRKRGVFDEGVISKKDLKDAEDLFRMEMPHKVKDATEAGGDKGDKEGGVLDPFEGIVRFPIFYDIEYILDVKEGFELDDKARDEVLEFVKKTGVKGRGRPQVIKRLLGNFGLKRKRGDMPTSMAGIYARLSRSSEAMVPKRYVYGDKSRMFMGKMAVRKWTASDEMEWNDETQEYSKYVKRRMSVEYETYLAHVKFRAARREYYNMVNRKLTEDAVLTEAALQFLSIISLLKETVLDMDANVGTKEKKWAEKIPLTKMDIVPMVAELMAEFILSGARERMNAQGLSSSHLYESFKVYPLYVGGLDKADATLESLFRNAKMDGKYYVGVMVEMKHYGVYIDLGRGPTKNSMIPPGGTYLDSPFYKALYQWALDNVYYANTGVSESGSKRKLIGASIGVPDPEVGWDNSRVLNARGMMEKNPEAFPMVYADYISKKQLTSGWDLSLENSLMEGATPFMKKYSTKGWSARFHKEAGDDGGNAGKRNLVKRGKARVASVNPMTFDDIVYAIYRSINEKGFIGNRFLSDTLEEMMESGKMEYFFSLYMEGLLRDYTEHSAKSILKGNATTVSFQGGTATIK